MDLKLLSEIGKFLGKGWFIAILVLGMIIYLAKVTEFKFSPESKEPDQKEQILKEPANPEKIGIEVNFQTDSGGRMDFHDQINIGNNIYKSDSL